VKETKKLVGVYFATVDNKGRFSLPSKFRKEIEEKIILFEREGCLWIFGWKKFWQYFTKEFKTEEARRQILAGTAESKIDKQGRILIPKFLREIIGKEVAIVGHIDHLEVMNIKKWIEYKNSERR
jgi:MraZ protein